MEAELADYRLQLEAVEAALKSTPTNAELLSLAKELGEIIELTESAITETAPVPASPTTTLASSRKRTATEAYGGNDDTSADAPVSYNVGDNVQAKWITGDHAYYPARITSITGSAMNPVYIVSFTSYNTTETLTPKDIKPVYDRYSKDKKTKTVTMASSNYQSPSVQSSTSAVISQAPTLNPGAIEAGKKTENPDVVGKKAAKKIKATKELAANQSKWKDFAAKGVRTSKVGKVKKIGENSMFRVPEGVNGRVGFTGSGQAMRKDIARERHIYQRGDGVEE